MTVSSAEQCYEIMKAAYEGGINFFDNAEGYGECGEAERIMGAAVNRGISPSARACGKGWRTGMGRSGQPKWLARGMVGGGGTPLLRSPAPWHPP